MQPTFQSRPKVRTSKQLSALSDSMIIAMVNEIGDKIIPNDFTKVQRSL